MEPPVSLTSIPRRRVAAAGLAVAGLALLATARVAAHCGASAGPDPGLGSDDAAWGARVARSPLNAVALRTLAERAEARGDVVQATRLAGFAGALGWRDGPTQLLLLRQRVARNDAAGAMLRLDAILRLRPGLERTMLPLLDAAAHDPAGRTALTARLAPNPPWRAAFFQQLDRLSDADIDSHAALLVDLAASRQLDRDRDLAPFVRLLAARGEDARARGLWVAGRAGPVVDAGFAHVRGDLVAPPGAPYVWVAPRVAGVELWPAPGGGLVVRAEPSAFGTLLEQRVVLAPGHYRLRLRMSAEAPLRRGALRWVVACVTGPALYEAAGVAIEHHRDVRFDIPQGCAAQRIALEARRPDGVTPVAMRFGPMVVTRLRPEAGR